MLHTPYPEPLTQLAGTRRVLETAHKLVGNSWGDEGTTREQRAWTADPECQSHDVRSLNMSTREYAGRTTCASHLDGASTSVARWAGDPPICE